MHGGHGSARLSHMARIPVQLGFVSGCQNMRIWWVRVWLGGPGRISIMSRGFSPDWNGVLPHGPRAMTAATAGKAAGVSHVRALSSALIALILPNLILWPYLLLTDGVSEADGNIMFSLAFVALLEGVLVLGSLVIYCAVWLVSFMFEVVFGSKSG